MYDGGDSLPVAAERIHALSFSSSVACETLLHYPREQG